MENKEFEVIVLRFFILIVKMIMRLYPSKFAGGEISESIIETVTEATKYITRKS